MILGLADILGLVKNEIKSSYQIRNNQLFEWKIPFLRYKANIGKCSTFFAV